MLGTGAAGTSPLLRLRHSWNSSQQAWQQQANVPKSSEELAAEAKRYAPGGHRASLLAAAHFKAQQQRVAALMEENAKAAKASEANAPDFRAAASSTTPPGRFARYAQELAAWTAKGRPGLPPRLLPA